jgi:hypothetical protein
LSDNFTIVSSRPRESNIALFEWINFIFAPIGILSSYAARYAVDRALRVQNSIDICPIEAVFQNVDVSWARIEIGKTLTHLLRHMLILNDTKILWGAHRKPYTCHTRFERLI